MGGVVGRRGGFAWVGVGGWWAPGTQSRSAHRPVAAAHSIRSVFAPFCMVGAIVFEGVCFFLLDLKFGRGVCFYGRGVFVCEL